jgi:hypothetical protein
MKTKWYLILLVGLVFILVVLALGCESINRVDNAEFFLKRALDQVGDMRQSMWDEGYVEDLDFKLEAIENDLEDALQELYYFEEAKK